MKTQVRPNVRFGQLLVLEAAEKSPSRHKQWLCLCDCGTKKIVADNHLTRGDTRSCGCLQLSIKRVQLTTHSKRRLPEYRSWAAMKQRCLNPRNGSYMNYGGRGISICREWIDSFEQFFADMGPRPSPKHSIDRINNEGNYEPSNCRWATYGEQALHNRRTRLLEFDGRSLPMKTWSELTGIPFRVIWKRLNRGWSIEEALTTTQKTEAASS
jgi:hypothetical protein